MGTKIIKIPMVDAFEDVLFADYVDVTTGAVLCGAVTDEIIYV